jgi:transposase-like protein
MNDSIQRLRSEAQRLARGKDPHAIRYPARFRAAAVALARRQLRSGHAVDRVAEGVGVTTPTLARWLRSRPVPGLRPVAVIDPPPTAPRVSTAVLVTPHGVRVEGLDAEGLVAVLRALG